MGNTNVKNGRNRIRYCKECEYWNERANLAVNINNAADTRDVTIYCPQGFDAENKRGWYSPAVCMKKSEDMPDIIKKYLEKIDIY